MITLYKKRGYLKYGVNTHYPMLQHVMSSADVFASCMQGLGIGEKIIGVLYNKLKGSVSPFSLLVKKSSLKY